MKVITIVTCSNDQLVYVMPNKESIAKMGTTILYCRACGRLLSDGSNDFHLAVILE